MNLKVESTPTRSFPDIPKELMEKLNTLYPLQMPEEGESDRSIWIRVGRRQVIDHLLHEYKRQHSSLNVIRG